MPHIKRSLITGLVFLLLFAGTGYAITLPAHAQSTATPTDTQTLLAQLFAQLAVLQQKIADLGGTPIEIPPQLAANPVPVRPIFSEGRDSSGAGQACALTRTLSFGATGGEVVCLQQQLIAQGLLAPDSATGFFGSLTESAVKQFQAAHDLEQVGHVGPLTRGLIAGLSALEGQGTNTPPQETTPPQACTPRPTCLDATPRCLRPEPAGGWCSATHPQGCTRDAKICPDGSTVGRTGPDCSFAACSGDTTIPGGTTVAGSPDGNGSDNSTTACNAFPRTLALGSQGKDVSRLQQMLADKGLLAQANVTGFFGPLTQRALATFQAQSDITAVGVLGPITRIFLQNHCDQTVTTPDDTTVVSTIAIPAPTAGAIISNAHHIPSAAPAPGTYAGSRSVTLTAPGATIIHYTLDGTAPSCATGSTYTSPIAITTTKTIKAIACYKGGSSAVASFAYVIINITTTDTIPPTVSLTAPAANVTVSNIITISATAADNIAVTGVQFKLDGANLGAEDTTAPYSTIWNTTTAINGAHTLTAIARDAAGNTKTATAVTVTVSNTYGAPTATPVAGAYTAVQNITLTAPGAASIHYTLDGTAPTCTTGSTYTSPIAITTTKTIKAIACYAGGSSAVASFAYVINVTTSDTIPPTVSLTAPASGATLSGTVAVSANASDNIAVTGVQFKLDGVNLGGEDTTAPYSTSWNTTPATNGTHTLAVVARDGAGNRATSTVTVTVSNQTGFTIPPILVGWEFGQGNVPANQLDQIAPTSNVVHIGGSTDANIIGKVQAASAKGIKSIIGVQRYFFATAQMKDGTTVRSSLRASGEAGFDALWAALGSLQLQNDVIGFFVIDEPYGHLQDVGFDDTSAFQGPGPQQLRRDIDHVIGYLHAKAPGRLTFIPFTAAEIQQSTFASSNAAARLLPPTLDLIGIDCYEECVTNPNTGENTGKPAQLYQRIVSVKAPSQKIAPTFSPGAREPYMSAEKDLHFAAQLAVWKNVIAQYPGQTRLYIPSGYQTAIRPQGDTRSNTYGASSMPHTYRAYNIYMSGLLGRTPDLSPRCTLSVYPSQIVAGQSARIYWMATDATSLILANGRGNSHALVPISGGSEALSPGADTTYTATAVKEGRSTTCSVTLDVLAGPPPGPFSYALPVNGATVQSSSVTLKWGKAVGATSYEVYAGTSRAPADAKPVATGVTETSYVFNGLQPGGTSYHWLIKAVNANGTTTVSGSTNPWSFTTGNF